jgi:UDP:flavonoid glycosyltransferase YjiC (YdhE family)
VPYAPFSELLPRCAALVHHGGVGTMSQAMAAGVPQLVQPMSHDQPDNAERIKRMGIGDWLSVRKFTAGNVAAKLRRLLNSPDVAARCAAVAKRFEDERPLERTADLIEQLGRTAPVHSGPLSPVLGGEG